MKNLQTNKTLPTPTLSLRAATWADVNAVTELIYAVCEADGDTTVAVTPQELEHAWREDGFNIETDTFIVETADGRVVGYEEFINEQAHAHLEADGYVHPQFKGHGIGTMLLTRVEERAREEISLAAPDLRVFLRATTDTRDAEGKSLLHDAGFTPVRYHWRMEIQQDAPPPKAIFPPGIELRPFDKETHARIAWEAENDAFSEHWGFHASTFDEWTFRKFERPEFDPSLWSMAWAGDELVGFSQNRYRMGIGWIGTLGIRKPWRKNGLGLALLHHSFGDFHQRGMKTIGLGVDASNATGATRLYERAGMSVMSEFVSFEKELRPGRDLEDVNGQD